MLFQEPTPDTSGYMIAGYIISFIVMGLYVASIYIRNRNLQRDMTTLEEMDRTATPVQAARISQPPKTATRSPNHRAAKPVTKKSRQK